MVDTKSLRTLRGLTIGVGCFNIIHNVLVLAIDHYVIKHHELSHFLVCVEFMLDLLLCGILIIAAAKRNHWLTLPWLVYNSFYIVFRSVNLLLNTYKCQLTNDQDVYPTPLVLRCLVSLVLLSLSWLVVVMFYHECKTPTFASQLIRARPVIPRGNNRTIYLIKSPQQTGPVNNNLKTVVLKPLAPQTALVKNNLAENKPLTSNV